MHPPGGAYNNTGGGALTKTAGFPTRLTHNCVHSVRVLVALTCLRLSDVPGSVQACRVYNKQDSAGTNAAAAAAAALFSPPTRFHIPTRIATSCNLIG